MRFAKLAEYYEKLEGTSKRLELVDILSLRFERSLRKKKLIEGKGSAKGAVYILK